MSTQFATRATLNEVVELINSGSIVRAEEICRAAVERNPRDVNMLGLLGAVLIKMKRLQEAEHVLRETIALAPTFAKPHEDLGVVLYEMNRRPEAVEILERATRLDPELDLAYFVLGKALADEGRGKEADAAFEKSFELAPERKMLAYAAKHRSEGRPQEAERLCRQVLRRNPRNVDGLRLLGNLAFQAGRAGESERLLRKAISIAPDFAAACIDLGNVLKEQDRYEDAILCFRQAIKLEPHNFRAYYLLGGTLAPAALTYDALAAYERTLEIAPEHPGALLGLGHTLKTVGRQQEAIDAYRKCIELRPDNGEIYWSLANLKTYRFTDAEILDMESRVARQNVDSLSKVNFMFALAKAYEDRGDHEQAWRYYRDGNDLQRSRVKYDPVQTEIVNNSILKVFTSEFLEERSGTGCPDPAPIFVMGLPRSGSTLIEQILASHSQVEGTSELPYVGRVATSLNLNRADGVNYPEAVRELEADHLRALGEDYMKLARMHRTEGTPHFIDKMPNNFPNIGLVRLILPNARIVDARRHPFDACVGCYRQLFARGQTFTYDLTDIGEYYLQYQRMMDYWHEVMPGRILTVQYEDMVTDFGSQVRRLVEFCGLPWEDGCLHYYETDRPVRTASSEQVRKPIYADSVGRWRNYDKHLDELRAVLGPILPRYRQYEGTPGPIQGST